jgi:hypothetical protein
MAPSYELPPPPRRLYTGNTGASTHHFFVDDAEFLTIDAEPFQPWAAV